MLTLTRKSGEALVLRLGEKEIGVMVDKKRAGQVKLSFAADDDIQIIRKELLNEPSTSFKS